jgi:hypothetical protein
VDGTGLKDYVELAQPFMGQTPNASNFLTAGRPEKKPSGFRFITALLLLFQLLL